MSLFDTARFAWNALVMNGPPRADPEAVARVQRRRLEAVVRHAVRHSPFYRRRYAGVDLDRFRLADLPPVTKPELMAHYDDALTVRDVRLADLRAFTADLANVPKWFRGRYAVSHTSGSQGQPIIVVQDRATVELFFLLQVTRGNASGRSGVWEALKRAFRPARLAVVVMDRGFYPSWSAFAHRPEAMARFVAVRPLSLLDPDLVVRLNDFQPTVLSASANVLGRLASEAEEGRLRLRSLRHLSNHSETLAPEARERLGRVFGVPVLNTYAASECLFLTNGCPTDPGAHVNADWCVVEVVDRDHRPVPPGTPGERVLVTNLANRVQPFIRYELADRVTAAPGPCRCGSRLPRLLDVDGRRSEDYWVGEGADRRALPPFVFKAAFELLLEVREWQAVQDGPGDFTFRVELLPGAAFDAPRARALLDRELRHYGFADRVRYGFEVVPALGPDPRTGKFKQAVSRVGRPGRPEPAGAS